MIAPVAAGVICAVAVASDLIRRKTHQVQMRVNPLTARRWDVVARAGIEPATFHFSGGRSYRLSYLANRTGRSHSRGSGPISDPDGT